MQRVRRRGRRYTSLGVWLVVVGTGQGTHPLGAQEPGLVAPVPVTVLVNVAVVPMDRERLLTGRTVVVRGDRIVALGPAGRVRVPPEAVRVDGRGKFLLPGLADMHQHSVDDSTQLLRLLARGVTTVRDMHAGPPEVGARWLALKQALASGQLLGPHVYTAGDLHFTWRDRTGQPTGMSGPQQPGSTADSASIRVAADSTAQLKTAGFDFVKVYGWVHPLYDSVIAAAHRVGPRVRRDDLLEH